jgi:chromatin segregation and condensation protein Rec8/ScpA/Scc1 (kleisin family)
MPRRSSRHCDDRYDALHDHLLERKWTQDFNEWQEQQQDLDLEPEPEYISEEDWVKEINLQKQLEATIARVAELEKQCAEHKATISEMETKMEEMVDFMIELSGLETVNCL